MPFPTRTAGWSAPEDPESLYRVLAETNDGPAGLWVHQGAILHDWHASHQEKPDVAIELPTGAGKTLVGGLIAEYRRQAHRERAVIACPTRQLARQTADRLMEYGVPHELLIGRVRDWSAAARANYSVGNAVAVTVYSHIFNSNPALDDADIIVFDDAHAAEQAVASPWTLSIERASGAYMDVLAQLGDALDPLVVQRLQNEALDFRLRAATYLASPAGVAANSAAIEAALAAAVANRTLSTNASFAFVAIQGHVDRSLIYVSHRSILIRPLVAPTSTHDAFASPRQRVYMSATLGSGGELERAFGKPAIARIPVPRGWDRQGSGRRFFAFPAITEDLVGDGAVDAWVSRLVGMRDRALVLAATDYQATELIDRLVPPGWTVMRADDVEDDLQVFTQEQRAALVLANRYDGIDLPDDDCRLVVLAGLPSRGDLQERFLHDSLGAIEVLRERVRARFAQGAGRATRNVKDHAAVVVLGDELINYVSKREVASALHPEIQAELDWGAQESRANTGEGLLQDLGEFFSQSPMWQAANADIVSARERKAVASPPGTDALAAAAPFEVQAWQAAWEGNWDRAVEKARRVIDELRGGRDVQRYAALWYYLLANWVPRLVTPPVETPRDYLERARAAGRGTTWLDHLAAPADRDAAGAAEVKDEADVAAIEGVLQALPTKGRNAVFETMVTEARSNLVGTEASAYESGLVALGELAGAESKGNGGATAAPDAGWRFADKLWVSWEAKSEAVPTGELGAEDVRQAGGHLRYMESDTGQSAPRASYGLLVTPQTRVHPASLQVAEDHVYLTDPVAVVEVFDRIVRGWRRVRAVGAQATQAYTIFAEERALPSQWGPDLRARPLVQREL